MDYIQSIYIYISNHIDASCNGIYDHVFFSPDVADPQMETPFEASSYQARSTRGISNGARRVFFNFYHVVKFDI